MPADFAQLYSQLGIRTDCSLEEFKQACRRRIRQQHPDRSGANAACASTQIPLAELLPLYAKALRFHRKHGRLPGAAPVAAAATRASPPSRDRFPAVTAGATSSPAEDAPRASLRGSLLMIVLATVVVVAALNSWNESTPAARKQPVRTAPPDAVEGDAAPVSGQLEIGMDMETVRQIQGEPMQRDGSEWLYGPSWLRFERGRLVDWYSSPLHRLKTATGSAPVDEKEEAEEGSI